jgi:hypothetical protein
MGSGDATFYAEDLTGRKTGFYNGDLIVDIPHSYPIFEFADTNDNAAMFVYPSDITLKFYLDSLVDSEDELGSYSFMIWDNSSFYALDNTSCIKNTKDEITFTPRNSNAATPDYSFRFRRGDVREIGGQNLLDYAITIAKEFYNSPKLICREYIFTSGQNEKGAEIELYVSDDYDDLIVETYDTSYEFSVITRSTESFEDNPDIDYIPQSKESFSLNANDKMVITPDDWATSSTSGAFSAGDDQTPGFELILGIFAILFVLFVRKKKK